jgi:hypothetical protein
MALALDMVEGRRVNRAAVDRRAAALAATRSVKKQWQAAWLVNAVRLVDLTTLAGDDTAAASAASAPRRAGRSRRISSTRWGWPISR